MIVKRIAMLTLMLSLTNSAMAGTIILSGDSNPLGALNGGFGVTPNDNARFFENVLGHGKTVGVISGNYAHGDIPVLNAFYNSLSGVSSTAISGTLTTGNLANISLLIVVMPDNAFTASEVSAVQGFLSAGKTLFIIGDNSTVANGGAINSDLIALGSALRIHLNVVDGGSLLATVANHQILSDSLTAGVNRLTYGGLGISTVSGGKALVLASNKATPFIAVERSAVPEPGSMTLMMLGATFLGGMLRLRHVL